MYELNEETVIKAIRRMRTLGADALRWEVTEAVQELPKKLLETISAFSNMQGGTIILGLSEKNGFRPAEGFDADRMYAQMQTIGDAFTPVGICQVVFPKMFNCSEPLKLRTGALPLRFATPGYFKT